jgi:dTDP-4-dehydrorhamnose reductase
MRVLVLGGGQIAKAVGAAAPAQHEVAIRTHAELDIVDEKALAHTLAQVKADWIVNAAAYTAVDLAEDEAAPGLAFASIRPQMAAAALAAHVGAPI